MKDYKDLRKGGTFGQKLNHLSKEHGMNSAAQIAAALWDNDICFSLVHTKNRPVKYISNKDKDIPAFSRRVLEHLDNDAEAQDIPSNYMLAYSILFNVSLDYLYGRIDEMAPDAEVLDISRKTGLSAKAVTNLVSSGRIYLEGFLYRHYQYEFLFNDADAEASIDVTSFWSDLLESKMFSSLPEAWVEMACTLQLYKAISEEEESLKTRKLELPSRQEFYDLVDEYYATHGHDPCFGTDPYEIYDHDKPRALEILKDMDEERLYELSSDKDKAKTVYWGCAGMFDRMIGDHFHNLADSFEIPTYDLEEDD